MHHVRKIGIYGGTFDPIHHAHLVLAREAMETLNLEEVIFVPAAMSPHKLDRTPTAAAVRLEMLRGAIADEPGFRVDDSELQRPPPSFTIDTVEKFVTRHAAVQLHYLLGSDNLPLLHTWHRFVDLRKLVTFVVLNRGVATPPGDYVTIHRQLDISATDIRNRVATGRSIQYLVPTAVGELIHRHQLYQEPTR